MIFLANAPFSRSVQSTILTRCWPRLPPPLGMKMSPCSQVRVRNRKIFPSFCHLNVAPVTPKWLIPSQLVHLGGVPASLSSSAFFVARLKWNEIRGIKKAPDANFGTGNLKNFPLLFPCFVSYHKHRLSDFNYDLLSFKKSSESFIDFLEKEVSLKKLGSFSTEYIFSVSF